jgi:hypothetical protein
VACGSTDETERGVFPLDFLVVEEGRGVDVRSLLLD